MHVGHCIKLHRRAASLIYCTVDITEVIMRCLLTVQIVLIVAFFFACIAGLITTNAHIFLGTMILGVFIGYLIYTGWYD